MNIRLAWFCLGAISATITWCAVVIEGSKKLVSNIEATTSIERIKSGEELCKASGGLSTYGLYTQTYVCKNGTKIELVEVVESGK